MAGGFGFLFRLSYEWFIDFVQDRMDNSVELCFWVALCYSYLASSISISFVST